MSFAKQLSELAQMNSSKKKREESADIRKISSDTDRYVEFVLRKCQEKAANGMGGTVIAIDKTTDLFGIDEGRDSAYSHDAVVTILKQKELALEEIEDMYDTIVYNLIWDKDLHLDRERIGTIIGK